MKNASRSILSVLFSLLIVFTLIFSSSAITLGEFKNTQAQIEEAINQFNRDKAYNLIQSLKVDSQMELDVYMKNLSRMIWISKQYELSDDTIQYAIELYKQAEKSKSITYQIEAMDALAFMDYYNFNNDLARKKWSAMAGLAVRANQNHELYRHYRGLALLSIDSGSYDKALSYYQKALEITSSTNMKASDNTSITGLLQSGMAEVYVFKKDYASAIQYDTKSLVSFSPKDIEHQMEANLHLADDYQLMGNPKTAQTFLQKARSLHSQISDRFARTKFVSSIDAIGAAIAYENGNYKDASTTFFKAYMAKKKGSGQIGMYVEAQNTASSFQSEAIEKELNLLSQLKSEQAEKMAMQQQALWAAAVAITLLLILIASILLNLKRQQVQKELFYRLSTIDQLTQLKNRRKIVEDYELLLPGTKCIALLDVDCFKLVNDTYGHAVGDLVLKRVAATIQSSLRDTDDVGRYGGEEFLLLIDTSDLEIARTVAERIRTNVEQLTWEHDALKVTVSIGLVYAHRLIGDSLLATADHLLYESKQNGRNRLTYQQI